jgi:hypothetical protein
LLEGALESGKPGLAGFDAFTLALARFLTFKGLEVPDNATFDLLVSKPAQPSTSWPGRTPWGVINLGEEPTSVVFINQPAEQPLTLCPDYPPVRLRVEPGEGLRFPAGGLLVAGCTLDKHEVDMVLVVRHGWGA